MNNIKDTILKRIKEKELTMKPRAYFLARHALLALVAVAVLCVTVFLFNFIFFSLRVSGHAALLRHGAAGLLVFLRLFPWLLLTADVALIMLLESLLRRFRFAYRHPALYVFLVLLALGISAGIILDRASDMNERLLHHADRDELPGFVNDFYRGARRLPPIEYRR